MLLVEAEASGYKRFAGSTTMDVAGSLICIVGPNGAGKSSFLDALVHFNSDDAFEPSEWTRAEGGASTAPSLRLRYELEDVDREVLVEEGVPEAISAETIEMFKSQGPRTYRLLPRPLRDLKPRQGLLSALEEFQRSPWLEKALAEESQRDPPVEETARITELLARAIDVSRSEQSNLDTADINELGLLGSRLANAVAGLEFGDIDELPKKFHPLSDTLNSVVVHEKRADPHDRAVNALQEQIPLIRKFEDADRQLRADYDLNGSEDVAISNLLRLAGTTWVAAKAVADEGDPGRKTVWEERANKALKARITQAWGQSALTVQLRIDGHTLTVMMAMQADDYIKIDQQSDGLRQFVALRAFIALEQRPVKPIILFDEAETHLHYDAQADLVEILEEQLEASKIIYTTHSAGCLPRDLGVGVRGVVPLQVDRDGELRPSDHSQVINAFWSETHGFSPVLIAMGASAFAFAAAQKAVITEGFTDALLLPSLIREATGMRRLPYSVVPGFARASADEVQEFDLMASRLVVVADGDQGGTDSRKFLTQNGISEDQILFLGGEGSGISLEDLVSPDVYVRALNAELSLKKAGLKFPPTELPVVGRSKHVAKWAKRRKGDDGGPILLGKAAMAQRILDQRHAGALADPEQLATLRTIDNEITGLLAKSRHTLT